MRAAREKQEEALAMMQMQNTVQNLQQLDKILVKSEKMVCLSRVAVLSLFTLRPRLAALPMLRR